MLPADVTLTPVTEHEFLVIRALAETIWRQHYAGIISCEQVDYMLAGPLSDDALREPVPGTRTVDRTAAGIGRIRRSLRSLDLVYDRQRYTREEIRKSTAELLNKWSL